MSAPRIALLGDYDPQITAHRAIPLALQRANAALGTSLTWTWLPSDALGEIPSALAPFAGLWVVPGSPYKNTAAILAAIRYARENQLPFLGTCGGFQHALIEFARTVLDVATADHAETNPRGDELVVTRLSCSLVEQTGEIHFTPGSQLHRIFQGHPAREGYHCNYGPSLAYRDRFEAAGLHFTGFDSAGEIRAAELPAHPFFIGTLFQPERAALRHEDNPLILAFARAVAR